VPPTTGSRAKPDTRRLLLSRRDALTERERTDASRVICARAAALIEARCEAGALIALYANKGSEVETTLLDEALRAGGFRIAYPRVIDDTRVLSLHEVEIVELEAAEARWGLREPHDRATLAQIDEVAAFVVPGVGFDKKGGRIGWGKGHYDATLAVARANSVRIGLAFECQMFENVPRESHDQLLDAIVTEAATHVVA
jgi:5-formyltetrahydrofolate cyclo-ligase